MSNNAYIHFPFFPELLAYTKNTRAVALYCYLRQLQWYLHEQKPDSPNHPSPSIMKLAKVLHCSERQVKTCISQLKKLGWIKVLSKKRWYQHDGATKCSNTRNVYIVSFLDTILTEDKGVVNCPKILKDLTKGATPIPPLGGVLACPTHDKEEDCKGEQEKKEVPKQLSTLDLLALMRKRNGAKPA